MEELASSRLTPSHAAPSHDWDKYQNFRALFDFSAPSTLVKNSTQLGSKLHSPVMPAVYVSPITDNVSTQHIREIFGIHGTIDYVEFFPTPNQARGKSTCKVVYYDLDAAQRAIASMDGGVIDNESITVRRHNHARNESDLRK